MEKQSEWLRLPALHITADPPVDLGVFFPNPDSNIQAVGNPNQRNDDPRTDHTAALENATRLPTLSLGYRVLSPNMGRNYGTYELVELIRQVGDQFDSRHPGREFLVGDLSKKRGGTIRDQYGDRIHSSHRNGLDADINYIYTDCVDTGSWHNPACALDIGKTLELIRLFVHGGPDASNSLVDSIYVSDEFRTAACSYVMASASRQGRYGDTMRYLKVRSKHMTHFHLRIRCPAMSNRCPKPQPPTSKNPCTR